MSAEYDGLFVTGTDTGIGKTFVSLALMAFLQRRGFQVAGMKPVATGCEYVEGILCNDDALRLRRASSCHLPYERVNPYAFAPPVSPNIAAELAGRRIDLSVIDEQCRLLRCNSEKVVVEGVGGWEVPLNETEHVSDLAKRLGLPVVLVVGLKLGCLNHAILSERAILAAGVDYLGWLANTFRGNYFLGFESNVRTLRACLKGTFLGHLPYAPEAPGTDASDGFAEDFPV